MPTGRSDKRRSDQSAVSLQGLKDLLAEVNQAMSNLYERIQVTQSSITRGEEDQRPMLADALEKLAGDLIEMRAAIRRLEENRSRLRDHIAAHPDTQTVSFPFAFRRPAYS